MNHTRSAIIFDMDGVLVDSYEAHFKSWREMASRDGVHFSQEDFNATFGRVSREIVADLWGEIRGEDEIIAMEAEKERIYQEIIKEDFPFMPDMAELLVALHDAGFALAVGSSGPIENVQIVLAKLDAEKLFEAQVTARDVTRGKPDPEVFLTAASRVNVPPSQCCVVEDAPAGIQAAQAAGMAVVGLASTGRTVDQLKAADLVVREVSELSPEIFQQLIDGKN